MSSASSQATICSMFCDRIVMTGIDQDAGLRPGGARQQQCHPPIGDVGVVERRLEGLVLDQQPLARGQCGVRWRADSRRTTRVRWRMLAVPG